MIIFKYLSQLSIFTDLSPLEDKESSETCHAVLQDIVDTICGSYIFTYHIP